MEMLECNAENVVEVVHEVLRRASQHLSRDQYSEYCEDLVQRLARLLNVISKKFTRQTVIILLSLVPHFLVNILLPHPVVHPIILINSSKFTGPVITPTDEARVIRYPDILPPGRDKSCQVNFAPTLHIDAKTSQEEVKRFAEYIQVADLRAPPIFYFWSFYHKKIVEVSYILKLDPIHFTKVEIADVDELWIDAEAFRPVLATMLLHGHLQMENSDLLLAFFGNLPAYVLEFMVTYIKQTNRVSPGPSPLSPRRPCCDMTPTTIDDRQRFWNNISTFRLAEYQQKWLDLIPCVTPLLEIFRDTERCLQKFPNSYHATCCNYDFMGIFMGASRVNSMFSHRYLPMLDEPRQWRSLPFSRQRPDILDAIGEAIHTNTFRGVVRLETLLIPQEN